MDTCTTYTSTLLNVRTQRDDLISTKDKNIYELINYVVISGAIAIFGLLTNIINIVVFYKQGFSSTVNISLFALAISDVCNLLSVIWVGIGMNPLFANSDIGISAIEILYLTGGMPHVCFVRITGLITVYITAERCLCIALPLKIKQIVTPTRTTRFMIAIYMVLMMILVPEYATSYHCWKFYEMRNQTLLGLCFTSGHDPINGLAFFLYSTIGSASFVAVIVLTFILVIQLNKKSKWRMQATFGQDQLTTSSNRERKAMTMVVMISTLLIVCYTPGAIASMIIFLVADFNIFGAYVNTSYVIWSFVFVLETVNSSINIIFYYKMSVKYRDTFCLLFRCWFKDSTDFKM